MLSLPPFPVFITARRPSFPRPHKPEKQHPNRRRIFFPTPVLVDIFSSSFSALLSHRLQLAHNTFPHMIALLLLIPPILSPSLDCAAALHSTLLQQAVGEAQGRGSTSFQLRNITSSLHQPWGQAPFWLLTALCAGVAAAYCRCKRLGKSVKVATSPWPQQLKSRQECLYSRAGAGMAVLSWHTKPMNLSWL